jgi:membrane-associated protease RseP (regulator of RpoE activity)
MWGSDPMFGIGLLMAWTIGVGAGSALLHEYGHAWTARAVGWNVVALRWRWYGVALVADPNGKPDQLWKVALGGLSVTALLALGFLAATALPEPANLSFGLGFAFNALLLLTNLVPARPFDGGYVLAGLRRARSNDPPTRVPSSTDAPERATPERGPMAPHGRSGASSSRRRQLQSRAASRAQAVRSR